MLSITSLGNILKTRWKEPVVVIPVLFCITMVGIIPQAWGAASSDPLPNLIKELVQNNPELKALRASSAAAREFIPQSSALADPRVGITAMNLPVDNLSLQRTPMSGVDLSLRQAIPFPGKRLTRKRIAKAGYRQADLAYRERLNLVVAEFRQAMASYRYILSAIEITTKTAHELDALANQLEARYAAGKIPQQDVLRTRVEASKMREQLNQLHTQYETIRSRVNSMLARPANTALPSKMPNLVPTITKPLPKLRTYARTHRPLLAHDKLGIEIATRQRTLARLAMLPDFDFFVGYRIRDNRLTDPVNGANFTSFGVTINVPLWAPQKQRHLIRQRAHELTASRAREKNTRLDVDFQVDQVYYQLEEYRKQFSLYRDRIIPEARAAWISSLRSYEAKEVDYTNLINTKLDLLRDQLALVSYSAKWEQASAALDQTIGKLPITFNNQEKDHAHP